MEDFIEMSGTSEKTGDAARLAPLFWHFQLRSLADPDAEQLIESTLKQFKSAELTKISVRDYVDIVDGFANLETARLGPRIWRVSKSGAAYVPNPRREREFSISPIATACSALAVTEIRCSSPSTRRGTTRSSRCGTRRRTPNLVGLQDSGWRVSHLARGACGWTFDATGFGPGDFTWYNAPAGRYEVSARGEHGEDWRAPAEADSGRRCIFQAR